MNAPARIADFTFEDNAEELAQQITLLAGQINAATHRLLKLIAEFDNCKGWSGGGTVRTCAHWLNWQCGIVLGAAREKVRVAHRLEELPLIDAAFEKGEISYSKVRAMTRVATADNEDYLLMIARHGTASHMEKLVGKFDKVKKQLSDRRRENEQENNRKLLYYQDEDGMWVIHAKLPPEAGEQVIKALEAVAAPIQAEHQKTLLEHAPGELEDVSAETFSETVEREEQESGNHFQELLEHTRADALVKITEHFLATSAGANSLQALKGAERCQIMLHVDIDTLQKSGSTHSHGPHCCEFEHQQWLSPDTARRLSCDASLVTVLENNNGEVLNIGRRARTVPPAIRRALALRDKTCRVPGCCESRYVDAHHIRHWADGGETSLDNLVTLCRYHHRLLHQGGFSIEAVQSNGVDSPALRFSTPAGITIETSVFPQFPDVSAETSAEAMRQLAPNVDATTGRPYWTGEAMDYGMAIDGLLRRSRQTC
ncbi:DUF222 domain-containing protein [Parahaliea maris]|uniref:DUF222 domain-containing protein n=1 Tax=Parahaliea maris TaxID=2716870 RepID=A0A5C8ZZ26_9GAMM|nr:HNH endonuclease signature motif containing protein [Parahaliea maris]TXS92872.1 DUF222 domain-containing protein [Parahaliea maris]